MMRLTCRAVITNSISNIHYQKLTQVMWDRDQMFMGSNFHGLSLYDSYICYSFTNYYIIIVLPISISAALKL